MPTTAEAEVSSPISIERKRSGALELGPRKRPRATDPLVHHGRHFGRTVHALCTMYVMITNGILRLGELAERDEDTFSLEERREHRIFQKLLQTVPGLQERILDGSEEEVVHIAELLQKGTASARSDDTKSLKSAILDWIVPRGEVLYPPLARNVKSDRGFHHERTGALLCPIGLDWSNEEIKAKLKSGETAVPGDQWPVFLYDGYRFDPEDPWNGLFRSRLLISAYKHVFTSPSSVDKEPKATRSGNARIHGMTQVTPASLAYVATQVRFALSSSSVFSGTDTITDSARFYTSVLDLFEDAEEVKEVNELIKWWNCQIFPGFSSAQRPPCKNSALARIKHRRLRLRGMIDGSQGSSALPSPSVSPPPE